MQPLLDRKRRVLARKRINTVLEQQLGCESKLIKTAAAAATITITAAAANAAAAAAALTRNRLESYR